MLSIWANYMYILFRWNENEINLLMLERSYIASPKELLVYYACLYIVYT